MLLVKNLQVMEVLISKGSKVLYIPIYRTRAT